MVANKENISKKLYSSFMSVVTLFVLNLLCCIFEINKNNNYKKIKKIKKI